LGQLHCRGHAGSKHTKEGTANIIDSWYAPTRRVTKEVSPTAAAALVAQQLQQQEFIITQQCQQQQQEQQMCSQRVLHQQSSWDRLSPDQTSSMPSSPSKYSDPTDATATKKLSATLPIACDNLGKPHAGSASSLPSIIVVQQQEDDRKQSQEELETLNEAAKKKAKAKDKDRATLVSSSAAVSNQPLKPSHLTSKLRKEHEATDDCSAQLIYNLLWSYLTSYPAILTPLIRDRSGNILLSHDQAGQKVKESSTILLSEEKPLVVFESIVEAVMKLTKVKRSSMGSISISKSSILP
jgi:hypothetical protein